MRESIGKFVLKMFWVNRIPFSARVAAMAWHHSTDSLGQIGCCRRRDLGGCLYNKQIVL